MKNTYHKFLIVSTIAIFFTGAYVYFSKDLNSDSVVPVAYGSSLVSSNDQVIDSSAGYLGDKIVSDISFLTTLVSLKKITIDTTIFNNSSFAALKNNTVKIESVVPGRINPFSPIENSGSGGSYSSPRVATNQPTQITDISVSLNGTINISNGVTDTYFEYGTTDGLGITTSSVKPSLVGNFIKNVSGLNPKTTYFSKACAKINGATLCGEVVSFTTN